MEEWRPIDPDKRGRHETFGGAIDAALADLMTEHNAFYDALCDVWKDLFPDLPALPGRYEDGKIYLYVKSSSVLFMLRPRIAKIRAAIATLPGAPKKIELRLEIHK